jgi:hypothetical protein
MDIVFLMNRQSSFPVILSIAYNRIGKTVNIVDLTDEKVMKYVLPQNMSYPYYYSNETLITSKMAERKADVNFFIVDNGVKMQRFNGEYKPVIVTGMLLREARGLAVKYDKYFSELSRDIKGRVDNISLIVEDYTDTRYTHRAIQDAIGLKIKSDNVFCISYSPSNIRVDISIDLASRIKMSRLSKEYKQVIKCFINYETSDSKLLRKVFK